MNGGLNTCVIRRTLHFAVSVNPGMHTVNDPASI